MFRVVLAALLVVHVVCLFFLQQRSFRVGTLRSIANRSSYSFEEYPTFIWLFDASPLVLQELAGALSLVAIFSPNSLFFVLFGLVRGFISIVTAQSLGSQELLPVIALAALALGTAACFQSILFALESRDVPTNKRGAAACIACSAVAMEVATALLQAANSPWRIGFGFVFIESLLILSVFAGHIYVEWRRGKSEGLRFGLCALTTSITWGAVLLPSPAALGVAGAGLILTLAAELVCGRQRVEKKEDLPSMNTLSGLVREDRREDRYYVREPPPPPMATPKELPKKKKQKKVEEEDQRTHRHTHITFLI